MRARAARALIPAALGLLLGGPPVQAQQADKGPPLALRIGTVAQVEFRGRLQFDWRDFAPVPGTAQPDVFDLHRARVGIAGRLFTRVDYQVERELHDSHRPWRDVYVDVNASRLFQVQAGHFKMPFSLDQLTSSMDLDVAYRTLAATYLAPGRDTGVMAHGRAFGRGLTYQAGVFRRGGENVRAAERSDPQTGRTVAGRITARPFRGRGAARALRTLTLGVAYTSGRVPDGLNSPLGRTVADHAFFPVVYVNGLRRRVGGELEWRTGPLSLRGELMRVGDQRQGEGTDDQNLPDVVAEGWYTGATWLVTGETKSDNVRPAHPFGSHGFGALELAGRIEDFRIGSSGPGTPARTVRASRLVEQGDRVLTLGVNWYLNSLIKVQANAIRERRDVNGFTRGADGRQWSRVIRVQVGL